MATDLTTLLGSELTVGIAGLAIQKTYTGFSGAHGIVSMNHGLRGYQVPIRGLVRITGAASYNAAMAACNTAINAIAAMQTWTTDTYTYRGSTYYNASFANFKILPRGQKTYHYTSTGDMTVAFEITLIGHTN
jgi:hypothetical protein